MVLQAVILDDDRACIDQLKELLDTMDGVHVYAAVQDSTSYMETLSHAEVPVDLVFLDIRLNKESGFEAAAYTRREYPHTMIVFTTAFDDMALKGYNYEALDFLVKPVQGFALAKTIRRALNRKQRKMPEADKKIGLSSDKGMIFVKVSEILFLTNEGRRCVLVKDNHGQPEKMVLKENMPKLEKMLDLYGFVRIHQSFLVPLDRIERISSADFGRGYEVYLRDYAAPLPVSRSRYKELQKRMAEDGITIL